MTTFGDHAESLGTPDDQPNRYNEVLQLYEQIGDLDPETQQLLEHHNMYVGANNDLDNLLEKIAQKPDENSLSQIGNLATTKAMYLQAFLRQLLSDKDLESGAKIVGDVLAKDDLDRVETLASLTDPGAYRLATSENLRQGLIQQLNQVDDSDVEVALLSQAMEIHKYCVESDMVTFIEKAREQYANSPEYKRQQLMSSLGKHAIDVAKIAAGAIVGGIIAQRFRRR